MMNGCTISIIIPHYNRSQIVLQTIASIEAQTFSDWEIIIIDDGSIEEEWLNIKGLEGERIKVYKRKNELKGPSSCRNIGIRNSTGKYILFLDSDDLLASFCLEQRVAFMELHPNVDVGIFNMQMFEKTIGDSAIVLNKYFKTNDEYIQSFIRLESPWQVTCGIWKKYVLEELNGFNEEMNYHEDPELHTRALLKGKYNISVQRNTKVDSFYRIASIQNANATLNLKLAVQGGTQFIQSINTFLNKDDAFVDKEYLHYKKLLGVAFRNVISCFFNDSKKLLAEDFRQIINYSADQKIITPHQKRLTNFILRVRAGRIPLNNYLHVKGGLTKLYLLIF